MKPATRADMFNPEVVLFHAHMDSKYFVRLKDDILECCECGTLWTKFEVASWAPAFISAFFFVTETPPIPVLRLVEVQEGRVRFMKLVEVAAAEVKP